MAERINRKKNTIFKNFRGKAKSFFGGFRNPNKRNYDNPEPMPQTPPAPQPSATSANVSYDFESIIKSWQEVYTNNEIITIYTAEIENCNKKIAEYEAQLRNEQDENKKAELNQKIAFTKKYLSSVEKILEDFKKKIKSSLESEEKLDKQIKDLGEKIKGSLKKRYTLFDMMCEKISKSTEMTMTADITDLKNARKDFTDTLASERKLNSDLAEAVKEISKISSEDVKEKYKDLLKDVTAKTETEVSIKYRAILQKRKELEEKLKNAQTPEDINTLTELISEIDLFIDNVFPFILENPNDFKQIKTTVENDLGYKPKHVNTPNKSEANPTRSEPEPIPVGGNTTSSANPTGNQTGNPGTTPTGNSGASDNQEPATAPTGANNNHDNGELKNAKTTYANCIAEINKLNKELSSISEMEEALYLMLPVDCQKLQMLEQRAKEVEKRIFALRTKLSDLEYEFFMNNNIILGLDDDLKALKVEEITFNNELEAYVTIHSTAIKEAYFELLALNDLPPTPENKTRGTELLQYIDLEKSLITRRIVSEKHKHPEFDAIGFISTHKIDTKKMKEEFELSKKPKENNPPVEGSPVIRKIDFNNQIQSASKKQATVIQQLEKGDIRIINLKGNLRIEYKKTLMETLAKLYAKITIIAEKSGYKKAITPTEITDEKIVYDLGDPKDLDKIKIIASSMGEKNTYWSSDFTPEEEPTMKM